VLRRSVLPALLIAGALPTAASALPASVAIGKLNDQRAGNGIPAGIVERADWSSACAKHNAYEQQNGGVLTHTEDSSKPGYTPEGAQAGANSVLSKGNSWADGNPFETAPIHLNQLLAPRLAAMGVDDNNGYVCATTLLGLSGPAPAADVVYTYPGDGTTGIYPSEVASEGPYTPGERVGIPQGATTGPYLYVLADGPSLDPNAHITAASLSGPSGPVEIKTVDNFTDGLQGYLPTGGEIIPVPALAPRATYHAHVALDAGGQPLQKDWSFTTRGLDPGGSLVASGTVVKVTSRSPAAIAVTFARSDGRRAGPVAATSGRAFRAPISSGTWIVCAFQASAGDYEAFSACTPTVVVAPPALTLARPRLASGIVSFALASFEPALAGRGASLAIRSYARICLRRGSRRTCRTVARTSHRSVTLRRTLVLRVAAPPKGKRVSVALSVPAFTAGGARYLAVTARGSLRR
jgi:hypothetical protein